MKIGDIVYDFNGQKWIVYDLSDDKRYLYVTDVETQTSNEYISTLIITKVEPKPKQVTWMFIERREKNLKGLEEYFR